MLILSTLATAIAAQSLITGCLTLISSAVTLNLFMKVKVVNTDPTKHGQIYIPEINLFLCIGAIILVVVFQKSMALAGAYGIAVVLTFNITNFLLGAALYYIKWPKLPFILPLLAILPFVTIDGFFLASNLYFKFTHGGWITMVITFIMTLIMLCWMYGRNAKHAARKKIDSSSIECTSVDAVLSGVKSGAIKRGNGIGVYLSPSKYDTGKLVHLSSSIQHTRDGDLVLTRDDTPPVIIDNVTSDGTPDGPRGDELSSTSLPTSLSLYLKVTGMIQRIVVLLHVNFNQDKPALNINERVKIQEVSTDGLVGIYAVTVSFGFAEPLSEVDMNKIVRQWILEQIPRHRALTDLFAPVLATGTGSDDSLWYFVHSERIRARKESNFIRRWFIGLYYFLHSISRSAYVFLNLPPNEVVQMGDVIFV
jgi:KUP system potassium uptake protein